MVDLQSRFFALGMWVSVTGDKAPTKKIQCFRGVLTGFFPVNQEDKVILQWRYRAQPCITQLLTFCKWGAQDTGQSITDSSIPEGQTLLGVWAAKPSLQRAAGGMGGYGMERHTCVCRRSCAEAWGRGCHDHALQAETLLSIMCM